MILCSCAVLTDKELERAIDALFEKDPQTVVTPGRVYHALGKRMRCHGCLPLVAERIARAVAAHHSSTPKP